MRPISKFGVFLVLAAILAFLFAFIPKTLRDKKAPAPQVERERTESATKRATSQIQGSVATLSTAATASVGALTFPQLRLNFPAIRGANNYGWVQLPHGTLVDLVRRDGRELWVRWDGILVKIDAAAAAGGAVVLKSPGSASSRG